MSQLVGAVATGLGLAVRFLLLAVPRLVFVLGVGLSIYAVSLWDVRLGFLVAGIALICIALALDKPRGKR